MTVKEKALIRALNYEEKARIREETGVECLKKKEREWGERRVRRRAKIRRKMLEDEGYGREVGEQTGRRKHCRTSHREDKKKRKNKKKKKDRKFYIYNKEYKKSIKEEKPEYLCKKMKNKDRKTIVRFRCGNEVREREHWKEEEEKQWLCRKEIESLWHVLKECDKTRQ